MATCLAGVTTAGHCCHLGEHGVCRYLRVDADGPRAFVCTFRGRHSSWEEAHCDPEYQREVKPLLDELGLPDCGDWPRDDEHCVECGVTG